MLISAVILASASSSSCVRGRSRWAPLRRRGASCRSCRRRLVFLVCSLVDCRTDFRANEYKSQQKLTYKPEFDFTNLQRCDVSFLVSVNLSVCMCERAVAILRSAKSWNSCGILLLSSTLVFSVFFCSSNVFFGLGLATFMGSFGQRQKDIQDLIWIQSANKKNKITGLESKRTPQYVLY